MSAKPKEIAIFPLNVFLLPGECIELHIFEERYRQLIKDCLEQDFLFGIVFSHQENNDNFGSIVKLEEVIKNYPGGEMDILVRSVSLFKLEEFHLQINEKLYPGGTVSPLLKNQNFAPGPILTDDVNKYLLEYGTFPMEVFNREDGITLFDIAAELNMSDADKLELIKLRHADKMENFLKNYLRYLKLLQDQEKSVYQNIYLN